MTKEKLIKTLNPFIEDLEVFLADGAVNLRGTAKSYDDILQAGKIATNVKSRGVVNDIKVKGLSSKPMYVPTLENKELDGKTYDVLIIGGGVVGCAIANELSKYELNTLVVEKENDVAMRTSSRNDGMIHPGIDIKPKYKKALYNTRGNNMYPELSKNLDFKFVRNGSYVFFDRGYLRLIAPIIHRRVRKNKIHGVKYYTRNQVKKLEPNVADWQRGGMYLPSSSIVCPYEVTIAFAEHAIENGVDFSLNTYVKNMDTTKDQITNISTNKGNISAKVVINAAGVYTDKIADMVNDRFFTIHPRKGTELVLDKKSNFITESVLAKFPFKEIKNHTKGGGIIRTIDGNILIGPNAVETIEREDDSTEQKYIDALIEKHKITVPALNKNMVITYFSGTRAATYEEDFVIEKSKKISNLIHAAGIQSPGLTAAPAIAQDIGKYTLEILKDFYKTEVNENKNYNPKRMAPLMMNKLSEEERDNLIKKDSNYGKIVCRCEKISKGEILDALNRPLKVDSVDAVKRRCRAGMGRCQGGFCSSTVASMIAKERNIDLKDVKKGRGNFCNGEIKEPNND